MRKSKTKYFLIFAITTLIAVGVIFNNYIYKFRPLTSNPTILMVFNGEYSSEAENSLASIRQNTPELLPDITICVSDDSSRNFAKKHNLNYFELSNITATGSYLSVPMNIMGRRKIECIMHLLEKNKDVFYMDTDIVFLSNPLPEFNTSYDLNIQGDECRRPYSNAYLCTGFMHIKSNKKTIRFFKDIIEEVVNDDYRINDQNALDRLVKQQGLLKMYNLFGMSVNVLDVCKFPNGCRYFDQSDKYCNKSEALIVHNNHIIGIENKRERFEKHDLIFAKNQEQ